MADATDAGWGYLANAPGFVRTSGPAVLSSRFAFEDSYTLERARWPLAAMRASGRR